LIKEIEIDSSRLLCSAFAAFNLADIFPARSFVSVPVSVPEARKISFQRHSRLCARILLLRAQQVRQKLLRLVGAHTTARIDF
jgi:hypothetical protein